MYRAFSNGRKDAAAGTTSSTILRAPPRVHKDLRAFENQGTHPYTGNNYVTS